MAIEPHVRGGGRRSPKSGSTAASSKPPVLQRKPGQQRDRDRFERDADAEVRRAPEHAHDDPRGVGELALASRRSNRRHDSFLAIGMRDVSFTVSSTMVVRVEVTPGTDAICRRSIWPRCSASRARTFSRKQSSPAT